MILDGYSQFIEKILRDIAQFNINVSDLQMDHIGYQASFDAEYDRLKKECNTFGELVSEKIVNGRRVGIFKFTKPLHFKHYTNEAIELIAPKVGQQCPSALEHVEFVIQENFESFIKKYPNVPWDVSSINQPEFPMIKLKLSGNTQVKFHLTPVLEIVGNSIKP